MKPFVPLTLALLAVLAIPWVYRTAWHAWSGDGVVTTENRQVHDSFFITFLVSQSVLLSVGSVLVIRRVHRSSPHNKPQQSASAPSGAGD